LDFHKQFWGVPLPLVYMDLVYDPSAELSDYENGRENDSDLLPQSSPPIIDTNWTQILICAKYPRIYYITRLSKSTRRVRKIVWL
jgi:hypothetical protein